MNQEDLDKELNDYMEKDPDSFKSSLDQDLDDYMASQQQVPLKEETSEQ